jgi:hypothetical protein
MFLGSRVVLISNSRIYVGDHLANNVIGAYLLWWQISSFIGMAKRDFLSDSLWLRMYQS